MNARRKILLYGLQSQKNFSKINAEKILQRKGFVLNDINSNCLYPHSRGESLKHWITKAIIFKILRERKRTVGTEVEVGNGIADVFDEDNKIIYEIEKSFSKVRRQEKMRNFYEANDVFFIDLGKVPDRINEAKKYLDEIVV